MQESNREKATILAPFSVAAVAAGPWKDVLSSISTRLYEEYGSHWFLQSYVRKHREAGCPSPEDLSALEWLLLHHTPEVAEREGRDPLAVLLTTVYLGCCDVELFVRAVVRCLEGNPAVERRLQEALMEFVKVSMEFRHAGYFTSLHTQVCNTSACDMCVHGMYYMVNHETSLQEGIIHHHVSLSLL